MSTPAGLRSILDSGPCGETKVLGYPAPAYEADHTSRTPADARTAPPAATTQPAQPNGTAEAHTCTLDTSPSI
jgi:hypothetical protein